MKEKRTCEVICADGRNAKYIETVNCKTRKKEAHILISRRRMEDSIKTDLTRIKYEDETNRIKLALDRVRWQTLVNTVMNRGALRKQGIS
jgi:hypothetical protein